MQLCKKHMQKAIQNDGPLALSRPLYLSFKEAKNFMAENGLYIKQVQTLCEVTSYQLDQQVTLGSDAIITSNHKENTQGCTLNSTIDLDTESRTEQRHEEDLDTIYTLTFQLPPGIMKTERLTTYWQDRLS